MTEPLGGYWRDWKYKIFYPHVRRKDAGYLASVLSEYAAFPIDRRRNIGNFSEVERCATALLIALDEGADADKIRIEQLRVALLPPASLPQSTEIQADPVASSVWLQSYMRQLFIVESAVLELQDLTSLLARAPFLLERFRIVADAKVDVIKRQYDQDLASDKLSKMFDASLEPNAAIDRPAREFWLRGKLTALLNDIHWWYAQSQVREELFLGQQLTVITTFLIGSLTLLLAFAAGCSSCNNKLTVAVMFFGLLGAFTSVMRRMHSDSEQHGGGAEGTYKELTALAYGKVGITVSLVFGVVFSLVLMLMFYAGFTGIVVEKGAGKEIFPTLPIIWEGGESCVKDCLFGLHAESGKDFAKLMVWAFVAGFAEQLVPDALDRLTKAADWKK